MGSHSRRACVRSFVRALARCCRLKHKIHKKRSSSNRRETFERSAENMDAIKNLFYSFASLLLCLLVFFFLQ
jgi:hypothetical protein